MIFFKKSKIDLQFFTKNVVFFLDFLKHEKSTFFHQEIKFLFLLEKSQKNLEGGCEFEFFKNKK